MKQKAVIIDTYSKGNYHEVINLGLLMMVSKLYESVTYIADVSSCNNMKSLIKQSNLCCDNVTYKCLLIPNIKIKNQGLHYLLHIIQVSWRNFIYYCKTDNKCDVFYNNNIFFAIFLIQFLLPFKRNKIYDICHNEMEMIDKEFKYNLSLFPIVSFLRLSFKYVRLSNRMNFIVLSEDMATYLKTIVCKRNADRIKWIDHCYIRPSVKILKKIETYDGIKIGIPGAITNKRGLPNLKQLLPMVSQKNVRVYAISMIAEDLKNKNLVILNKERALLPFDVYSSYVNQMDVLLFLYDVNSYKLTASGAILEAIWQGKPVIALSNYYFKYIFDKFGDIGILADDIETLSRKINSMSKSDFVEWHNNIARAKHYLHPSNTKHQLLEIINEEK